VWVEGGPCGDENDSVLEGGGLLQREKEASRGGCLCENRNGRLVGGLVRLPCHVRGVVVGSWEG